MPTFCPNDFMFKTFKEKVKSPVIDSEQLEPEPWEIYAWCLRDVMAKTSGLKTSDIPLRKKLEYENFMNQRRNEVEYDGVVYKVAQNEE